MGMKIFGVTLVRSEADIIAVTIRYHLQLGLDGLFVLDNASSDGTDKILERLAQADDRIRWSRHEGEYQQAELTTGLAREALRAGADWIVPFDADEFWYAPCCAVPGGAGQLKGRGVARAGDPLHPGTGAIEAKSGSIADNDTARPADDWSTGRTSFGRSAKDWICRGHVFAEMDLPGFHEPGDRRGKSQRWQLGGKAGDYGGACLPARADPVARHAGVESDAEPTPRGGPATTS